MASHLVGNGEDATGEEHILHVGLLELSEDRATRTNGPLVVSPG